MKKIVLVLLMSAGMFFCTLVPLFTTVTTRSSDELFFKNALVPLDDMDIHKSSAFGIREVVASHVTRHGLKDGAFCVVTTECSSEVHYSLDGGLTVQSSPQFLGLAAGTYEVVARMKDLYAVKRVTISQPAVLEFTTALTYSDSSWESLGSLMIIPTGGIPPFKFSVDKGATFQVLPEFIGLAAGLYQVLVEDSTGTRVGHDIHVGS